VEKVSADFADRNLPYEAALSSLDLDVTGLKAGRNAEVWRLAMAMEEIFTTKKIDREALEALRLFWEAARQETATVELARRVIAEVEKARRSVPSSSTSKSHGLSPTYTVARPDAPHPAARAGPPETKTWLRRRGQSPPPGNPVVCETRYLQAPKGAEVPT
jgi:hypothetical protein